MDSIGIAILAVFVGIVVGVVIMIIVGKAGLDRARVEAKSILEESKSLAENEKRQANLDGKQQVYEMKLQAEKELKDQRNKIQQTEMKLQRREDNIGFREENLHEKEKKLEEQKKLAEDKLANLGKMEEELQSKIDSQIEVLEKVANMSQEDARKELMDAVEKKCEKEISAYLHEQDEIAQEKAADNAKNIIANAIQRYSQDEVLERTVSVVTLPNEDMKGRIIGREGRNIKAIEQATGVDLIIDDTPDVITVSCFDPIRREVARQSLEILMKDGRIQPSRIEEVVNKVKSELDESIAKYGDEAVFKLGIGRMNRELVKLIGRLRYRYSYGQNCLEHSVEVATFTGIMAAELGLNQSLAKRAGLLHDIGKATDHETEGSHVEIGVEIATKFRENPTVIDAIASHHGDKEAQTVIAHLVAAADTLSAARPGARSESLDNYIKRLQQLEELTNEFKGVDKTYALQAGREVRIIVKPEEITDAEACMLAREIKNKIETTMNYPGNIKVVVIREVRVQETAR